MKERTDGLWETDNETTATRYTPGPWETSVFQKGERIEWTIVGEGGGDMVADLAECPDNAQANAQLIAAAPELLDACMEFVRKCDTGAAQSRHSYAQMVAAIAKAEGRAQ